MNKTILIPITNNFFARNFLNSDAFLLLKNEPDLRLVFLAHKNKLDFYRRTLQGGNVLFEQMPPVEDKILEKFFRFLEQSSIVTSRTRIDHVSYLLRGSGKHYFLRVIERLPIFLTKEFFRLLGHFGSLWRALTRFTYKVIPSSYYKNIFDTYRPNLIFCPTMVWSEDYALIREAQKAGIKTSGQVFSWDTFYSKTFLRLHPDLLIVQTDYIKKQAETLGDFPSGKIVVTGVAQYDYHFKKDGLLSRQEFFKQIGADPKKKLILYALSGKAAFGIEFDILDILHSIIREKELSCDVQVLLRPYPKLDFSEAKLELLRERYGFLGRPSTTAFGSMRGQWSMDEDDIVYLLNSLAHADIIINMYSTFLVEGAIFNKPLIAPAFDGYKKRIYWNSGRRFFDWDHLRDVKRYGGVTIVHSRNELTGSINNYLQNPDLKSAERRKIVKEQCQFTDGRSGERVARVLIGLIRGK